MLREHYYSPDNGQNWYPKRAFESAEEIISEGFSPSKWHPYECGHCDKFHVAKVKKA